PLLAAGLLWGISFTSYSAFMGHLGKDAAAANSVSAIVRDLVCCMCNGIAGAAGIIVGNELGDGNLDRGKNYGIRLMKIAFICGFVSAGLMLTSTPFLLNIVKLTDEARGLLVGMMLIMSVYMVGRAVNTIIINGIFSAGGDTKFDMYSLAIVTWGVAVPLAALGTFAFGWHPLVVYACTCLDEVGKIPWVMAHFRKYKWVKDITRSETELAEC
ncbi:MAG: MATE family efflux transporter, partial [Clostridia bacterium]|nr:MATE family efflux transporter [Clostridia bacterium]